MAEAFLGTPMFGNADVRNADVPDIWRARRAEY